MVNSWEPIDETSTQDQIFYNNRVMLTDAIIDLTKWNTLERYTLDSYLASDLYEDVCQTTVCDDPDDTTCVDKCASDYANRRDCCDTELGFLDFLEQYQCHRKEYPAFADVTGDLNF